jgi:hypothetical protein
MSCRRLVFDTGPLSSFAVVTQLDLLEVVCAGHGSWPLSVHRELRAGARVQPALAGVLEAAFLGPPEVLQHPVDLLEAELLRVRLAGSSLGQRHNRERPRPSSSPDVGGACSYPRTGMPGSWPPGSSGRTGWSAPRTCWPAPSGWGWSGPRAPGRSTRRCWTPGGGRAASGATGSANEGTGRRRLDQRRRLDVRPPLGWWPVARVEGLAACFDAAE